MSARVKDFRLLGELFGRPLPAEEPPAGEEAPRGAPLTMAIERKGRKGKTVTIIAGFRHDPGTLAEIARTLKEHCGTGGTLRGNAIELQGDQRERAAAKLRSMRYRVK